jgi:hypothetical protein
MSHVGAQGRLVKIALALALLVVVAVGPFVAQFSAQPGSRYALTAAFAEHGSVDIGPYRHSIGIDHALYDGHLRSDKAPGQPLLGVPFYVVGKWFGAKSDTQIRGHGDLGMWWQTLWSATIPFAALLALIFLMCARFVRQSYALAVALCLGVGTTMLPIADNLFGHILAALCAFSAWMVLERNDPPSTRALLGAGFLAALAVTVEYETGIILLVLGGVVLVRERGRIAWFVAGTVPPFVVLALYQWAAFGKPWHTPSTYYAGSIEGTTRGGYHVPTLSDIWSVLFGARGLWITAPIAFIAVPACVWALGKRAPAGAVVRRHAIVALAIFIPYLLLTAGWSGLPLLEEPGNRYIIPALPFLAVPLAAVWHRVWRYGAIATLLGAVVAVPAATTYILVGLGENAIRALPRRLLEGHFAPTIWSMAFGRVGAFVYVLNVAACTALLVRVARSHDSAVWAGEPVPALSEPV